MRLQLAASLLALAFTASCALAQEGPRVTSTEPTESLEVRNMREAIAYATPLPRGAPDQDYPLVAWCAALVEGHVALGRTLTSPDALDQDIMRLGALEATNFREALRVGAARQAPSVRDAADAAEAEAAARWTPLMALSDEASRSQAFGLFFGLPGRCEHAARRIRDNITTPPATLADVGLEPPATAE